MKLLIAENNILTSKGIDNINEGFRVPDEIYINGKDVACLNELGSDTYFSNYWYGDVENVKNFAEKLAEFFKIEYEKVIPDLDKYDFNSIVMFWNLGEKAMVGCINLDEHLAGLIDNSYIKKQMKVFHLKNLLNDYDDNDVMSLIYSEVSKKIKQELIDCVHVDYKEDYIEEAKNNEIKIKLK